MSFLAHIFSTRTQLLYKAVGSLPSQCYLSQRSLGACAIAGFLQVRSASHITFSVNDRGWTNDFEQDFPRRKFAEYLPGLFENLIARSRAPFKLVPSTSGPSEIERADFVGEIRDELRSSIAPACSLHEQSLRLSTTPCVPNGEALKSSYIMKIPEIGVGRNYAPRIYMRPSETSLMPTLDAETCWSTRSDAEESRFSPSAWCYITGDMIKTHAASPSESIVAGQHSSQEIDISDHSSPDYAHPVLGMQEKLRNLFGESVDSLSLKESLHSNCIEGFRIVDEVSHHNQLQRFDTRFNGENEGNPVTVPIDRAPLAQYQKLSSHSDPVYIALGSNEGDRVENIELACQEMTKQNIFVIRTSGLYETKPMYLENQQQFVNGVCQVQTHLTPLQLLEQLKIIEAKLGRRKTVENGPRTIDLDILLYGRMIYKSHKLSIPHEKIMEREFVLRPLCDLIPKSSLPGVELQEDHQSFEKQLRNLEDSSAPLSSLTPLCNRVPPLRSQSSIKQTSLMSILNLTPDSFSDGGLHDFKNPTTIISSLSKILDQKPPLSIIDIGGQSTRPHAPQISAEEELSRILPSIRAIRSNPSFDRIAISVDTYRASVASEAIEAGADVVNAVSAGLLDLKLFPTVANLGCTCILMHMRGTPDTMNTLTDYPEGIVKGVAHELLARVNEAEMAGIRRWRICLDPGIGFAKTQDQNLELLRRFDELRAFEGLRGFPWVVGVSRKGFVGKITEVEKASERQFGTAAAVTAAVQGGADIVRVHDVKDMGQVIRMSDAIWRT